MNHKTITCPQCQGQKIVKNGSIHNKKNKYKCTECGRQFVENPSKIYISEETKNLIDKLLLEKISLAGIARTTGVSRKWLQDYVNAKYKEVSREIKVSKKNEEN
jgi:transposase-like protein